jgi:predicted rRNA methylase YqxC with S4 and FtsJ domains
MGLVSPQVAEKIRQDERVIIMERTNLRYLERLPERVDLVTLDLSFISILLVSSGSHVTAPLILAFPSL